MNFQYPFRLVLAVCLTCLFAIQVDAQFGRKNRQAREQQQISELPVELEQTTGPWLIMCASFVGEDAEVESMQLLRELRGNGLKAYIYRHSFDYSQTVAGIGFDSKEGTQLGNGQTIAKPKQMKTAYDSAFEEIAVLVGDFPTVEDGLAQQTLQKIKYMMPESLGRLNRVLDEDGGERFEAPERSDSQRMRVWRTINKAINQSADKRKGPMGAAFLLANPLLPDEYFSRYRVDEFVMDLNRKFKHSLLENPGQYSVRVATFGGDSTFETDEIAQKEQEHTWRLKNGKSVEESKLALALAKAHRLTVELRKLNIPAYEFHDRNESYVCVGEFNWLKKQSATGEETQNPNMVEAIEMFKGQVENFPGVQGAVRPKTLTDIATAFGIKNSRLPNLRKLGIVFDVQPIPVQVPLRQVGVSMRKP